MLGKAWDEEARGLVGTQRGVEGENAQSLKRGRLHFHHICGQECQRTKKDTNPYELLCEEQEAAAGSTIQQCEDHAEQLLLLTRSQDQRTSGGRGRPFHTRILGTASQHSPLFEDPPAASAQGGTVAPKGSVLSQLETQLKS